MPDSNIQGLSADTSPGADSLVYAVDDPAGTPADTKVTVGDLAKGMVSTDLIDTANITYDADTDASTKGWVIDEDNMATDSATKVPTQQSVKAYVDSATGAPEGTEVLSTGETGGSKFLREDGDGTSSWQAIPGGGDMLASTYDPNTVSGDAFDQDNMVDGTTNKNFTATEQTKLTGIETGADVTDTINVTAAGALMDSEVTNLADVKAFNPTDYATAAQGATADSALQPSDIASGTITPRTGAIDLSGGSDGDALMVQADGSLALETPAGGGGGGGQTLYDVILDAGGGGDYTDFSTALAALTTGQSMFVRSGTYTEAAPMTNAVDGIKIVGENPYDTVLVYTSTSNNTWSGNDWEITGLHIEVQSSGRFQLYGARTMVSNCVLEASTSNNLYKFEMSGDGSVYQHNQFSYSYGAEGARIFRSNAEVIFDGNNWEFAYGCSSTSYGVFYGTHPQIQFVNNRVNVAAASTANAPIIMCRGIIKGNIIDGIGTATCGVDPYNDETIIDGNQIINHLTGIKSTDNLIHVSNNYLACNGSASGVGIDISSQSAVVTGNVIRSGSSGIGIDMNTSDYSVVMGNAIYFAATGIQFDTGGDNNTIIGNTLNSTTGTDISDSGSGNISTAVTDSDPLNTT